MFPINVGILADLLFSFIAISTAFPYLETKAYSCVIGLL
jgi:hypothetical protein